MTERQITLLVDNSTKLAVSPIVNNVNNVKNVKIWSPKQRRAYHRTMSGYKFAEYLGSRLRFMTLTTSNKGSERSLSNDLSILVKRIRRRYNRFEYIRVRTDEGNGVLHLIYRGGFIPQSWLSSQWKNIHYSWNVDIRDTQRYHLKYVINQYLAGQSGFERYSTTWNWVFPGYVAKWNQFKKWYRNVAVDLWDKYLYKMAKSRLQKYLEDYGFFIGNRELHEGVIA